MTNQKKNNIYFQHNEGPLLVYLFIPLLENLGNCANISMENSNPLHQMPSHADAPNSSNNQNILLTFSS